MTPRRHLRAAAGCLLAIAAASGCASFHSERADTGVPADRTMTTLREGEPHGPGELPDADKIDLPAPSGPRAVRDYLAGEGRPLVQFVEVTGALAARRRSDLPPALCARIIDVELPKVTPSPADLLDRASRVPDEDTRSILVNDIVTKGEVLSACVRGTIPPELLQEVAFTHRVAQRRLEQVR